MSNAGPMSGRGLKVSLSVGLLALTLLVGAVGLGLLSQSSGPDTGSAPPITVSGPAPTGSSPEPEPSSSSSVRIFYTLAAQQIAGEISVVVDGRPAGLLTVSLNDPTAVLDVPVTSAGSHTYRLAGRTTFRSGNGDVEVAAYGRGVVDASPGDDLAVRSEPGGQAIVLTLE